MAHATLLLAMVLASGWTWMKLVVGAVWLAMALFEQRRGPSLGSHWTAPAIGGVWLVLSGMVMCGASSPGQVSGLVGASLMGLGGFLRAGAITALGVGYSDGVRPVCPRVHHGVYAYFDHPGELGALSLAVGASVAVGSLPGLAWALLTLLPLTLYRFYLEESFLRSDASALSERADALAV